MQLLEIERRRYKLQQLSLFEQFKFSFAEVTEWREMGLLAKILLDPHESVEIDSKFDNFATSRSDND